GPASGPLTRRTTHRDRSPGGRLGGGRAVHGLRRGDDEGDDDDDHEEGREERGDRNDGVEEDEDGGDRNDRIHRAAGVGPDRQQPDAQDEHGDRDRDREGRQHRVERAAAQLRVDLDAHTGRERTGGGEDEVVTVAVFDRSPQTRNRA